MSYEVRWSFRLLASTIRSANSGTVLMARTRAQSSTHTYHPFRWFLPRLHFGQDMYSTKTTSVVYRCAKPPKAIMFCNVEVYQTPNLTLVRFEDEPRSCKHQLDISLSTSSCFWLVSLIMFFFCRHCGWMSGKDVDKQDAPASVGGGYCFCVWQSII